MLRKTFILISFLLLSLVKYHEINGQNRVYQIPDEAKYVPLTLIVKLKSEEELITSKESQILRLNDLDKLFSIKVKEAIEFGSNDKNARKLKSEFLSDLYKITLDQNENVAVAINDLLKYKNVVYAEPLYYEQLLFEPNDELLASQDHLAVIKAYDAWDITLGNSEIIVGIIDSGMQLDHEDLQNQSYKNPLEEDNGIDDDGNGLIDDIDGWDFADNDNDPTADGSAHGTRVAGVSGAHTNNAIGVAGVGYTSKIVPLKIFRTTNNLSSNSYEAIIYAADQGYDVINLSWGSVGSFSNFNQDVINYAAIEKDVVIVAAAGNTDGDLDFYPASYNNVLSVGASDINDNKASFATYSYHMDLMAPGESIFSTGNENSYGIGTGSSFSAPQVAGAAALVRSVFPELNALQVMQQLRITADDVYHVGNNNDFRGRLGKGRLNVLRAVTESISPSIRLDNLSYSGAFGDKIFFDDTVTVKMDFTNYLRSTTNAQVSISTDSPYATFFSESSFVLGDLGTLESVMDKSLKFYITPEAPPGERIIFRLDFTDETGYADFENFVVQLEQDYLTIDNGGLKFTVASDGNLGYAEDDLENGIGFQFGGVKLGDHFGIMVGNHEDSLSNNVVNNYSDDVKDKSFQKISNLKQLQYDGIDFYSKSEFEDTNESDFSLGLHIEQEILAWNDIENQDYLILEYRLSNNTTHEKNNLQFGFFADWNLIDAFQNKAAWDASNKLAYTFDGASDRQYAGVAVLTEQTSTHHGVDVRSENGNESEIDDEFIKSKKYTLLTSEKLTAGDLGTGNDVANLLSANIGKLDIGVSEKLTFVITAGETLAEIQANVIHAQNKYLEFLNNPPITLLDTACYNENFLLHIPEGNNFEIFDDVQMNNLLFTGNDFELGSFTKDTIIHYRKIDGNFKSDISGLKIYNSRPNPDFEMSSDTLYLGDVALNQVQFMDNSGDAVSWQWNFDNGAMSTLQDPKIAFSEVGTYQIKLTITTSLGCTGVVSKELLVANRSAIPTINDQIICKNETATISSSDTNSLKFYINEFDVDPILEGSEFTTGMIENDTVFYVSSVENIFESHKVAVSIEIDKIRADFSILLDTLDLTQKNLLLLESKSTNASTYKWTVNDSEIGTTKQVNFVFDSESNLNVNLEVASELNCINLEQQTLELTASIKPQISDTIMVCKYDSTTVSNKTGGMLYFYDNRDKSNLIHKGSIFKSGALLQDSIVYYTGVSSFRESELDSVLLRIIPFETDITASPEMLVLENERNVTFSSSNKDAISWRWFLQNELVETVESPTLRIDTAGIYDVKLVVKNSVGCVDTAYLTYQVNLITNLVEKSTQKIVIYPNPSSNHVIIKSGSEDKIQNFKLYNALGIEIELNATKNPDRLDISNLMNGIYILIGEVRNERFEQRLIIKK